MPDTTQSMDNANEGSDPSDDIKKQNPGATTTADMTDKAGSDEDPHKVENLTKAGREDVDPDAGTE